MNMRWHNKPGVKERRLAANASRARENRKKDSNLKFCRVCGVDISESCKWNRLCPNCQADLPPLPTPKRVEPTDEELDARALADLESGRT
jgi:hypothetical protein